MYVRIALSWRSNIAFSSSLTSSRASLATCSTCSFLISIRLLLFYRDALRQIARLIHVGSPQHRNVVRQQLQRHREENRREQRVHVRHGEHRVGRPAELTLARRDKGHD